MATILITGGGGFVAGHLKKEFTGADKVILADKKRGREVVALDITQPTQVERFIKKYRPDEIYHLAAISTQKFKDKKTIEKVNVQGSLNLLKAVRKYSPETKILLVSTGYVYGNCRKPAKETKKTNPQGPYAQSKLKMEREALKKFPKLKIYIVRSFNHSGAGQALGFFFPDLAKRISDYKKGKIAELEIFNGEEKRDFLHVKDVVRAYRVILKLGKPRQIYNVASGKAYKIKDITGQMIKKARLKKPRMVRKEKLSDVKVLVGHNSKLKALGWKPRYQVSKIISDTLK